MVPARPHPILTRAETSRGMIRSDGVLCKKNVRLIVTIFLRKHYFPREDCFLQPAFCQVPFFKLALNAFSLGQKSEKSCLVFLVSLNDE